MPQPPHPLPTALPAALPTPLPHSCPPYPPHVPRVPSPCPLPHVLHAPRPSPTAMPLPHVPRAPSAPTHPVHVSSLRLSARTEMTLARPSACVWGRAGGALVQQEQKDVKALGGGRPRWMGEAAHPGGRPGAAVGACSGAPLGRRCPWAALDALSRCPPSRPPPGSRPHLSAVSVTHGCVRWPDASGGSARSRSSSSLAAESSAAWGRFWRVTLPEVQGLIRVGPTCGALANSSSQGCCPTWDPGGVSVGAWP